MEEDAPPGVPEWVVTYGDMMSLLLTFFIMLVSMSEIVSDQKYRAVLESLHQRLGYRMASPGAPADSFPLNSVIKRANLSKLGSFSEEKAFGGVRAKSLEGEQQRVVTMPEGRGRRIGEYVWFSPDAELTPTSAVSVSRYAVDLRGKPNKLEVRSWVAREPIETRSERVVAAFVRARRVREALITAGVAEERIRMAVVPAVEGSDLIASDLARNGVVTLAVLDVYTRDYAGTPR